MDGVELPPGAIEPYRCKCGHLVMLAECLICRDRQRLADEPDRPASDDAGESDVIELDFSRLDKEARARYLEVACPLPDGQTPR